ncbi:molybdopterin-guanine dinucleotide biosynthesis protein B [Staphylococcus aureus]|uniref:molybdopterin-guanine dinucleotide biosynthesis protein B n=1 Tax=Staphylococcus aureus TaxID=1280 RepID=UPI0006606A44|nr:molybdopterin-guanine dinucleotide biosynthesis protein B [Staphylococcus aureus]HEA6064903.1 molybdopterin-guanine dinucleotide biosynthesis protein B [Staphylococcus aureus]
MILQIVGYKKSGKTTLMRHIVSFLKSHGYTVATIKHHGHGKEDIQLQDSDVDHMKHFEAGADQSIVQGFQYQQTVTRVDNQNLTQIIEKSVTIDTNIVLVEGFKNADFEKVVVYRNEEELQVLQQLSNVCYSINVRDHEDFTAFEQWLLNKIKNDCDTQLT